MSVSFTAGSVAQFTLKLPKQAVEKSSQKVIEYHQQKAKIPGFRPGKAPLEMVAASLNPQKVQEEAFSAAVDRLYQETIQKESLRPIAAPQVEWPKSQDQWPLEIKVSVEVFPTVTVKDYQSIKLPKPPTIKVSDEEVEKVITRFMKELKLGTPVEDRKAKKGDLLVLDLEGFDEKEQPLPDLKYPSLTTVLGEGSLLPEFDKALIGAKKSQVIPKLEVTFPKDYHHPPMAGKKVFFKVIVTEIQALDPNQLSAENMAKISPGAKTLEAVKENFSQLIERSKVQEQQEARRNQYCEELVKRTTADLPKSWIESQLKKDQSPDESKEARQKIEQSLKLQLALQQVVELAGITLSDAEKKELQEKNKNPQQFASASMRLCIDKHLHSVTVTP